MTKKSVNPGDLGAEIASIFSIYTEEVQKAIGENVQTVASETASELKRTSPKRTGRYSSGWVSKKFFHSKGRVVYRVKNKSAWQLTHLLEYGHAKKSGGNVRAIPHIEPANKQAQANLEKRIKESIKSI